MIELLEYLIDLAPPGIAVLECLIRLLERIDTARAQGEDIQSLLFGETQVPCSQRQPGVIVYELQAGGRGTTRKGEIYQLDPQSFADQTSCSLKTRIFDGNGTSQEESVFHGNLFTSGTV
jgi:hypothetical protein